MISQRVRIGLIRAVPAGMRLLYVNTAAEAALAYSASFVVSRKDGGCRGVKLSGLHQLHRKE